MEVLSVMSAHGGARTTINGMSVGESQSPTDAVTGELAMWRRRPAVIQDTGELNRGVSRNPRVRGPKPRMMMPSLARGWTSTRNER